MDDDQTKNGTKAEDSENSDKSEKSDDQKVSESEKSDKSEDQEVGNSESSDQSDQSDTSGNIEHTESLEVSEPEGSEDQKVPESPDSSDKSSTSAESSDQSKVSEESDSSKSSDTSDVPAEADSSDSSDIPAAAGSSDQPDISESSEPSSPSPALKNDVPGAHWYVVHTYSGHEVKVAATLKQRVESQQLQDKVLDILVPTQEKIEIKEGKKNKIKEKIFPGYLLIRMVLDDNTWLVVRTTPGITSFVGMGNKPTPLPEEEVASIQRFMSMEAPKFKASFSVGEAVKIVDGPFSEFLGSISEIDDERGKIKVLVSIFGRETPVELDFLQVAKL